MSKEEENDAPVNHHDPATPADPTAATTASNSKRGCCFPGCRIFYASQTGRAKACARRTARLLHERRGLPIRANTNIDEGIVDVRTFVSSSHSSSSSSSNDDDIDPLLMILLVSTTGEGEVPDQMKKVWKQLLQKSLSCTSLLLARITIAVFCLGDRAYGDLFCAAGRKLVIRLLQLGATLLCPVGYGDDGAPNGGVFADLDDWLESHLLPNVFVARDSSSLSSNSVSASESVNTMPAAPVSPYRVRIMDRNDSKHDHYHYDSYMDAYRSFWTRMQPASAYVYDIASSSTSPSPSSSVSVPVSVSASGTTTVLRRRATDTTGDVAGEGKETPLLPSPSVLSFSSTSCSLLEFRVTVNERLTSPEWEQDTRHLRLVYNSPPPPLLILPVQPSTTPSGPASTSIPVDSHVSSSFLSSSSSSSSLSTPLLYRAGDVAVVWPVNSSRHVERFLDVLPEPVRKSADDALDIQLLDQNNNNNDNNNNVFAMRTHWPAQCTLRGLLMYCADIQALPDREDLRSLAAFCVDSSGNEHAKDNIQQQMQQRDKLISFSETNEAAALYVDYILREKRSWIDVLYDFDTLRRPNSTLTITALLSLLSPMRPREFSIASSPTREQERAHSSPPPLALELCVAVVQGRTRRGRAYRGLCSNYLAQRRPVGTLKHPNTDEYDDHSQDEDPSIVRLFIKPGSFHFLPLEVVASADTAAKAISYELKHPVLFIGAGTGIAPLRGMIQEREAIRELHHHSSRMSNSTLWEQNGPAAPAPAPAALALQPIPHVQRMNLLFFGSRKESTDYYYSSEWKDLEENGRLGLWTAFSRDQWHKIYVQRVLGEQMQMINATHALDSSEGDSASQRLSMYQLLIEREGAIYVAGNPKMTRAVKEEILVALERELLYQDKKQVKQLLLQIQRRGRFAIEAWG